MCTDYEKNNLNHERSDDFDTIMHMTMEPCSPKSKKCKASVRKQDHILFTQQRMNKKEGGEEMKENKGRRQTHRVPSHPNRTAEPGSTDPSNRCPLVSPA